MFQNSVIGYFDMSSSPQPPGFEQFYYAAMRIIETGNNCICNIASNKPHDDDDGVKFAFRRRIKDLPSTSPLLVCSRTSQSGEGRSRNRAQTCDRI